MYIVNKVHSIVNKNYFYKYDINKFLNIYAKYQIMTFIIIFENNSKYTDLFSKIPKQHKVLNQCLAEVESIPRQCESTSVLTLNKH